MSLPIPDLRFEQSFISQLNKYAGNKQPDQKKLQPLSSKKYNHIATLTDDDLKLMNEELDIDAYAFITRILMDRSATLCTSTFKIGS